MKSDTESKGGLFLSAEKQLRFEQNRNESNRINRIDRQIKQRSTKIRLQMGGHWICLITTVNEKTSTYYSGFSQIPSLEMERKNYLISAVTTPYSETTSYAYERTTVDVKSESSNPCYTIDRIVSRRSTNGNEQNYNTLLYVYEGTHTGFPNENYRESGDTFEYGVYVYNDQTLLNYYKHKYLNDSDPLDYLSHYEGTVTTQKYNYASDRRYNIEEYVTDNMGRTVSTKNTVQDLRPAFDCFIGNSVAYTYDNYRVTEYNDSRGNCDEEQYKIRITYDPTYKLPLTVTRYADADTVVRTENTLTADSKSIAVSKTYVNNVLKEQYEYTYDTHGNVTQKKAYTDLTPGAEKYILTRYGYEDTVPNRNLLDGVYRTSKTVTGVADIDGNPVGTNGEVTVSCKYDLMGNRIGYTDARGMETTYTYDTLGALTSITTPVGTETRVVNHFLRAEWISAPDRDTRIHSHDPYGNCNGYFRYFGVDAVSAQSETEYSYNRYGLVDRESNAAGFDGYYRKQYTYDAYGVPTQMTLYGNDDEIEAIEKYTYSLEKYMPLNAYNLASNCKTEIYAANGETLVGEKLVTLNMYGDTVKETIAPATAYEGEADLDPNDCNALYYDYDKNGNRTETYYYTAVGQNSFEFHSLETSEYDYAGRLVKTTNALGQSILYTYDAIGRKLTETDYKGNIVYYTYDALGNLIKQDSPFDGDNRSVKKLYYDAGGNLIKEMQTKNAVGSAVSWNVREYAYDIMSRLSDVIVHVSTDSSGNTVKNYTHYEYNAAGDITAMYTGLSVPYSDTLSPDAYSKTTYTYDGAGLVTSVTDALNHTEYYTYIQRAC